MSKLVLNDISNLQNETSSSVLLNTNNALIEDALENTLSRDGTSPNAMESDLDMNSYRITNLPEPTNASEAVRLIDLTNTRDNIVSSVYSQVHSLLSGSGPPSSIQGLTGDFYIDTYNLDLYGPKLTDTSWGSPTSMQGDQGIPGPPGSGADDGDKGDISILGGVWSVDPGTITYAKMQNVSATDRILGRSSVGAGVVEEIPCTAAGRSLIDDATAADQRLTLGLSDLATQGDGDKGDITVSALGTIWTVDNSAITYAKLQNVSATDKLLGRSTAGAGVVEEITCTAAGRALLDDADAAAQRVTLGNVLTPNIGKFVIYRSSGGDDTSGINSALSSLGGPGTIFLPDSSYTIAGTLTKLGTSQQILGAGWSTAVNATGSQTTLFEMEAAHGAAIRNLKITGNCSVAITVDGCDSSFVDTVYIEGSGSATITTGISFVDTSGVNYFNRVSNCKINQCNTNAILAVGSNVASFSDIVNCNIGGNGLTDYGLKSTNFGWSIVNTEILSTTNRGIDATSTDTLAQGFVAVNLRTDSCGGTTNHGMYLSDYSNVRMTSCWSSVCGKDAMLLNSCNNITIDNSVFILAREQGLHLTSCTNAIISGNITSNNNVANGAGFGGIVIDGSSTNIVLSGNRSTNSLTGSAITPHQEWGLILGSSVSALHIGDDNDFTGNEDGVIYIYSGAANYGFESAIRDYASALSLTAFTGANITSISLTPGWWDVEGCIHFIGNSATTVNRLRSGLSTTSATIPADASDLENNIASQAHFGLVSFNFSPTVSVPVGRQRFKIDSTTTVYLVAQADFATNTCSAYGFIRAHKVV